MRPRDLYPLFAEATSLKGVGPRLAPLVERAAGPLVVDVLFHVPSGAIDRRHQPPIQALMSGEVATVTGTVGSHQPPARKGQPYRVPLSDDTGTLTLVFFHGVAGHWRRLLPEGALRVVSGKVELFAGAPQMAHPERIGTPDALPAIAVLEPLYPSTEGLSQKTLRHLAEQAVARFPDLAEPLDPALLKREGWPSMAEALRACHAVESLDVLQPHHPARRRLAYDELLANQLALAVVRRRHRVRRGRSFGGDGRLAMTLRERLPFALTGAQERCVTEISADLAGAERMLRLLQGDVGAGKTVVALLAMLQVVESGAQAAMLAPTDLLARQHQATLTKLLRPLDMRPVLLSGKDETAVRSAALTAIKDGAPVVVGTHALFQEDVTFADLGFAVVDEQHRFGVAQRLAFAGKGRAADTLVMTATPIPRTLALTAYGDMDVSRLDEKPPGRKSVDTRALPLSRMDDVVSRLQAALADGKQAYWVCPRVAQDEDTTPDAPMAAEERQALLSKALAPLPVGLVHGQMPLAQRDQAMAAFAAGALKLLVATTVIEVGVDVPQASIMVIENAEQFGLAQLHQLRGRVGRGQDRAACLLLHGLHVGETARERLRVLCDTEDGFVLAEADLTLRGAGEVLGTRQSGLPQFRLADMARDGDLLAMARDDARLVLSRDPELETPRGQALRTLLYLHRQDAVAATLRSG